MTVTQTACTDCTQRKACVQAGKCARTGIALAEQRAGHRGTPEKRAMAVLRPLPGAEEGHWNRPRRPDTEPPAEGQLVWCKSRHWPNDRERQYCACVYRHGRFHIACSVLGAEFHDVVCWWPLPE